jgi:hypothetical protein
VVGVAYILVMEGVAMTPFPSSTRVLMACAFVILMAVLGIVCLPQVAGLFGKGTDLTGRTVIWELMGHFTKTHPAVGWGPGGLTGSPIIWRFVLDSIQQGVRPVPHAHNMYLVLLGEVGFPGLFGYVFAVFIYIAVLTGLHNKDVFIVSGVFGVSLLLVGITEARNAFNPGYYVLYMLVYAGSGMKRLGRRGARPPPHAEADAGSTGAQPETTDLRYVV